MEWREMGRLAHDVGWAIEERKGMGEGRGGDGEKMITLQGMKKNLEEEKKEREEKDKQLEEERKGREEEKRKKEEAERREMEEKRKREEEERGREEEKRKMEEKIHNLEQEVNEMKLLIEISPPINYLSHFNLYFTDRSQLTMQDNRITHVGTNSYESCVFKDILECVCISSDYRLLLLFLF